MIVTGYYDVPESGDRVIRRPPGGLEESIIDCIPTQQAAINICCALETAYRLGYAAAQRNLREHIGIVDR